MEHTLLSAGLLDLGAETRSDEEVVGLELLQGLGGVVDEGEAGGLATTELRAQAEDGNLVLLGLVEAAELLAELILGDVGAVGVEDVTGKSPVSATVPSAYKVVISPAAVFSLPQLDASR
jgi:hypothetical protein